MKEKEYQFDQIFKALGDKHRIQILNLLLERERNAGELLEEVDVVQSTLSHHMKRLSDSGLVQVRKSGKWTYYSVSMETVRAAYDFLEQYLPKEGAQQEPDAAAAAEEPKTAKKRAAAAIEAGKARKKAEKTQALSHQSENSEDIFALPEEKKEKKGGRKEHEDVFAALPEKEGLKKEKAFRKEETSKKEKAPEKEERSGKKKNGKNKKKKKDKK